MKRNRNSLSYLNGYDLDNDRLVAKAVFEEIHGKLGELQPMAGSRLCVNKTWKWWIMTPITAKLLFSSKEQKLQFISLVWL
jgi:hypothetical protein